MSTEIEAYPSTVDGQRSGEEVHVVDIQEPSKSEKRLRRGASRLVDVPKDEKKLQPKKKKKKKIGFVVEIVSIIVLLTAFIVIKKMRVLISMDLWRWELMVLVFVSGRLLSSWMVKLVVRTLERTCILKKKVLYFVYALKSVATTCVWSLIVMTAWQLVLEPKYFIHLLIFPFLRRILLCWNAASFIWLLKTLLIKFAASKFHVKTYFNPIQVSLVKQDAIQKLSGPSTLDEGVRARPGVSFDRLRRWNRKIISARKMRKLINMLMIVGLEATTEEEAIEAAGNMFLHVAKPEQEFIYLDDVLRFLSEKEVEALETLHFFEDDGSDQKRISKDGLQNWVVNAFKERRALAYCLKDSKTVVSTLHQILKVVVGISIILISLLILGFDAMHVVVVLAPPIGFVLLNYGDYMKRLFEGVCFLMIEHPFDVGDHVKNDEVEMVVEEMNITGAVFLRCDTKDRVTYSYSLLASKPITRLF